MPAGTTPCGRPASHTTSQSSAPFSIGTYSSQPRSPTYEIRDASTSSPSTAIVFHVLNGNPSFETSSLVTDERMSRARGPQRPSLHDVAVRSSIRATPTRLSPNQLVSAILCVAPVTTQQ